MEFVSVTVCVCVCAHKLSNLYIKAYHTCNIDFLLHFFPLTFCNLHTFCTNLLLSFTSQMSTSFEPKVFLGKLEFPITFCNMWTNLSLSFKFQGQNTKELKPLNLFEKFNAMEYNCLILRFQKNVYLFDNYISWYSISNLIFYYVILKYRCKCNLIKTKRTYMNYM